MFAEVPSMNNFLEMYLSMPAPELPFFQSSMEGKEILASRASERSAAVLTTASRKVLRKRKHKQTETSKPKERQKLCKMHYKKLTRPFAPSIDSTMQTENSQSTYKPIATRFCPQSSLKLTLEESSGALTCNRKGEAATERSPKWRVDEIRSNRRGHFVAWKRRMNKSTGGRLGNC
jgi:hypothetical protein